MIPQTLDAAVTDHPEDGRREWLASLPSLVAEISSRWELDVDAPYEPGGHCAWVAPATTADGEPVALKVAWPHPEALHEADALRCWDGAGAVRLIAATESETCAYLLLERCVPGTPLDATLGPLERDEVVAALLQRLWLVSPHGHPFRPLAEMCDLWAEQFESRYDRAQRRGEPVLDGGLARDGIAMLRDLPRSAAQSALLCTDLHAENVLAARREPWLVIDPKPYIGDPCFDVLQHMLNEDRFNTDPVRLSRRMAALTDVNESRVLQWALARTVEASTEGQLMHDVARRLAEHLAGH